MRPKDRDKIEPDTLRFDLYTVEPPNLRVTQSEIGGSIKVVPMMMNVDLLVAYFLFESRDEFDRQIEWHGWAGVCPDWNNKLPIVFMPHAELLDVDHLGFILSATLIS